MFPHEIETERLRLVRLSPGSVSVRAYYDLWGSVDPAVFEFLSASPFESLAEARDRLEDAASAWEAGEAATYLIRPREGEPRAGELAGRTSLDCDWDRRVGDLGIVLDRPFWGRGYSGERARALAALAFETLDLGVLTAESVDGNERSRRAIESYVEDLGGQYDGVARSAPEPGAVEVRHQYSITRTEYDAATGDA